MIADGANSTTPTPVKRSRPGSCLEFDGEIPVGQWCPNLCPLESVGYFPDLSGSGWILVGPEGLEPPTKAL